MPMASVYSSICPACGVNIYPNEFPLGKPLACPHCHKALAYEQPYLREVWVCSLLIAIVIALKLRHGALSFIIIMICATLVLGLLGIFIANLLFPFPLKLAKNRTLPKASLKESPFDKPASLHLTDISSQKKPDRR